MELKLIIPEVFRELLKNKDWSDYNKRVMVRLKKLQIIMKKQKEDQNKNILRGGCW